MRVVAVAKVSHSSGGNNLSYITRSAALNLGQQRTARQREREQPVSTNTKFHELTRERREVSRPEGQAILLEEEAHSEESLKSPLNEAEAVWTWNTPAYVTLDTDGTDQQVRTRKEKQRAEELKLMGLANERLTSGRELTIEEKSQNARAYFELLSEAESRKGGINSYRLVLTIEGEKSLREMRLAVNDFLKENFPSAQALIAVHQNSAHLHAHVYIHARQLDGRKIDLKQRYFHLDESWAKVCAERFKDQSISTEHLRLKAETRAYRQQEKLARENGLTPPAKPTRWSDRFEVLHGIVKPWDDEWVGRLTAATKVAEVKTQYLAVTKAPELQLRDAESEAQGLSEKLEQVSAKRALSRSEAKRALPAEIMTLEEQKEIARFSAVIKESTQPTRRKRTQKSQKSPQLNSNFEIASPEQQSLFPTEQSSADLLEERTNKPQRTHHSVKQKETNSRSRTNKLEPTITQSQEKSQPDENRKPQAGKQSVSCNDRVVLGQVMMAEAEVRRLQTELAQAHEHGEQWRFQIYDSTHRRVRAISEFEIKKRCEARTQMIIRDEEMTDRAEKDMRHREVFEKEFSKHDYGINRHREMVRDIVQGLEDQLSQAEQTHEFFEAHAHAIRSRYAQSQTQLPVPFLSFAQLNSLQDQAIADRDAIRLLELEKIREQLAAERGVSSRTDHDLARLNAQRVVADSDDEAQLQSREEFEQTKHLWRRQVSSEQWSVGEIDQQLLHLAAQARFIKNPKALIPNPLASPGQELPCLAFKLAKNLNLSPAKREQ